MSSAPQPEPNETLLIGRIRAGDQGAMAVLYDRYSSEAKGFAVTIEKEGRSQTPTMPIVMAGV